MPWKYCWFGPDFSGKVLYTVGFVLLERKGFKEMPLIKCPAEMVPKILLLVPALPIPVE